jgi:hypothetical protein
MKGHRHRQLGVEVPDRTEVLCAVSRLVVVRPVGAAPVRCVYSRPERGVASRLAIFCITRWLQHVEEPRPGPGWCTGSAQHCQERCRIITPWRSLD